MYTVECNLVVLSTVMYSCVQLGTVVISYDSTIQVVTVVFIHVQVCTDMVCGKSKQLRQSINLIKWLKKTRNYQRGKRISKKKS